MTNAMTAKDCCRNMVYIASFTTVRSKHERVEPSSLPPLIQRSHVCEEMVDPVSVWRVLFGVPLLRRWIPSIQANFGFAFIINAIKAHDALQENMELFMLRRVLGDFVKRLEYVDKNVLIRVHLTVCFVQTVEPWNLYEPAYVVRYQLVINNPGSKLVPLADGSAIDGNTPFNELIFAGL